MRELQEPSHKTLSSSVQKSKSYEERELEYNEARSRIFNTAESVCLSYRPQYLLVTEKALVTLLPLLTALLWIYCLNGAQWSSGTVV